MKFLFNPAEAEKVRMFPAYATPQKWREWLSI
jgi:hypothetical protein